MSRTFANMMSMGMQGAGTGATAGAKFGPKGAAAGGAIGMGLGLFGGYFASKADAPYDALSLEEARLDNQMKQLSITEMMRNQREQKDEEQRQRSFGDRLGRGISFMGRNFGRRMGAVSA
jgi:hypothetical protein